MKKILTAFVLMILLCTAALSEGIPHRYADKTEGAALMMANQEYYAGYSQNDLDFRCQHSGATMEEYQAFAVQQVEDFTEDEIKVMDTYMASIENTLSENGWTLPPLDEIIFIKTTMHEECDVTAYTHGVQIYISSSFVQRMTERSRAINAQFKSIIIHEIFHCLTRCNPEFRTDMYSIIHFTTEEHDFPLPPSEFEYHISNPDVEHHDAWATFVIHGEEIRCFTDFVTTRHFEQPGDMFFDYGETALIPVDGFDVYYTKDQAENFDEIFGKNTGYVIDPEECMADNFSYALAYGMAGPDGRGYADPEIIEAIMAYLSRK